jgi:hypothetical protein
MLFAALATNTLLMPSANTQDAAEPQTSNTSQAVDE